MALLAGMCSGVKQYERMSDVNKFVFVEVLESSSASYRRRSALEIYKNSRR